MNEDVMTADGKSGVVRDAGELSVEAVRQLIEREHKMSLPSDAPELLMVTIMQAALNEEKRLRQFSNQAMQISREIHFKVGVSLSLYCRWILRSEETSIQH